MTTPGSISVLIRTYSVLRWDGLVACLESVLAQTLKPTQIVVVVDHNPDLFELVKNRFTSANVVENHYARGSSGAWNSGVSAATGEIIAFIDDDAVAAPNWLEQLVGSYRTPQVTGVGGKIMPKWLGGRPTWFPEEFDWVVGCTYKGLPESLSPVRNLIGCNMSFRSSVFDIVGGFRSGMGHVGINPIGCDETELCIRLRQRQPETILLYEPLAVVHHSVPPERATFRYFVRRCKLEGGSKALVAHFVGAHDGLSSERSHTFKVLPQAIGAGIRDAILHMRPSSMAKVMVIVIGLTVTAVSYVAGWLSLRQTGNDISASERVLS